MVTHVQGLFYRHTVMYNRYWEMYSLTQIYSVWEILESEMTESSQ